MLKISLSIELYSSCWGSYTGKIKGFYNFYKIYELLSYYPLVLRWKEMLYELTWNKVKYKKKCHKYSKVYIYEIDILTIFLWYNKKLN